jgi:hypothetical protein
LSIFLHGTIIETDGFDDIKVHIKEEKKYFEKHSSLEDDVDTNG